MTISTFLKLVLILAALRKTFDVLKHNRVMQAKCKIPVSKSCKSPTSFGKASVVAFFDGIVLIFIPRAVVCFYHYCFCVLLEVNTYR